MNKKSLVAVDPGVSTGLCYVRNAPAPKWADGGIEVCTIKDSENNLVTIFKWIISCDPDVIILERFIGGNMALYREPLYVSGVVRLAGQYLEVEVVEQAPSVQQQTRRLVDGIGKGAITLHERSALCHAFYYIGRM